MSDYIHRVDAAEREKIARFARGFAVAAVAFVLFIVLLFVTADRWLTLISIESERQFIEPYIELMVENDLIDGDPVLQDYVRELAYDLNGRLPRQFGDDFELKVYVVDSDLVNAFATLGGYIFVFDGLIEAVDDENSLAMVIAHEVAHVHHRDPLLGAGRGLLIQVMISALSGSSPDPSTLSVGSEVVLTSYSRDQEMSADELALELLYDRYGHAGGATTLFELIDDDFGDEELARFAEFLSTHPDTDARIERIDELIKEQGWSEGKLVPYPESVQSALRN